MRQWAQLVRFRAVFSKRLAMARKRFKSEEALDEMALAVQRARL
jgi:hypothetical protein